MTWIDIVCLICIVLFALIGLWRGLLKSIFRLCAWTSAIIGAYLSYNFLADIIAKNVDLSSITIKIICICLGFLIPFLIFLFIGHITNKTISGTSISKMNRLLGALLGAVKAYFICFVVLSILHILPVTGSLKNARNTSTSYSIYKSNLELFGFSSKEIDLIGMAEKKASELSKEFSDKAAEKTKETFEKATEKAKEEVTEPLKENSEKIANNAKKKLSKTKKKLKKVIDEEGDEIEYESNADIPIDE